MEFRNAFLPLLSQGSIEHVFAKIIYYAFYLEMILWRMQRSSIKKKMSARTIKLGIFMSLIHLRWQYGWRFPTVAANVLIKTHKNEATYGAAPKQLSYCQKEINQIQHLTILYCIQLSYTKSWNRRSNWHGSVQSLNHKLIKSVGSTQHTKPSTRMEAKPSLTFRGQYRPQALHRAA